MIDLITIVFREELPLLRIQARSYDLYIQENDVNQITISVNDDDGVADLIDPAWWGRHQSKVVIKTRSQYNFNCRVNGWESQQLLKLLAAGESTSTWAAVLDAKTWFVRSVDMIKVFDENNRVKTKSLPLHPFLIKHFEPAKKFIDTYFNINVTNLIGPAGVPFLFHSPTVKEMIASVDNFPEFFQTSLQFPHLVTEFTFYTGYVTSKFGKITDLYTDKGHVLDFELSAVNIAEWQLDKFDDMISGLAWRPYSAVSIHRKTYQELTPEQLKNWLNFIKTRNLITTEEEAQELINTYIK